MSYAATVPTTPGVTPRHLLWRRLVPVLPLHDADTFRGDIKLGFNVALLGAQIRALGFDDPEVDHTDSNKIVTPEEIKFGKQVRGAVMEMLVKGKLELGMSPDDPGVLDKYGRVLGYLRIRGPVNALTYLAEWIHQNKFDRSQMVP